MPKKVKLHPNERLDLVDLERIASDYTAESLSLSARKTLLDRRPRILEGFRIEIPDQDSFPGEVSVYNGVALNRSGTMLYDEAQENVSKTVTLPGATQTFYLEIEFVENDSDSDARAFWDPTFDNGTALPGKEASESVPTRVTPTWQIKLKSSGFSIDSNPSSDRIPLAVLSTDGANKITPAVNTGLTLVNAATVLSKAANASDQTLTVVDAKLFKASDAVSVDFGGTPEAHTISSVNYKNGIINLTSPLASQKAVGAIVRVTGVPATFMKEREDTDEDATHPSRAARLFQGNKDRGRAFFTSKETYDDRDSLDVKSLKDYVDFLSAQIYELKYGDPVDTSRSIPKVPSGNDYYDYVGSVLATRTAVTIGDGVNSFGDFNGTDQQPFIDARDHLSASGGKIFVKDGTYTFTSTVTFSKPVVIQGASRMGVLVKRGGADNPAFSFSNTESTVQNLTVQLAAGASGTKLLQISDGTFTLKGCQVDGGVELEDVGGFNSVVFEDSIFDTTTVGGGCISGGTLGEVIKLSAKNCKFLADSFTFNVASSFVDSSFQQCLFSKATGVASLFFVDDLKSSNFENCEFINNSSSTSSGLELKDSSFCGFTNCIFKATNTSNIGAPLFIQTSISNCSFDNCEFTGSTNVSSTCVDIESGSNLSFSNCAFTAGKCVDVDSPLSEVIFDSCNFAVNSGYCLGTTAVSGVDLDATSFRNCSITLSAGATAIDFGAVTTVLTYERLEVTGCKISGDGTVLDFNSNTTLQNLLFENNIVNLTGLTAGNVVFRAGGAKLCSFKSTSIDAAFSGTSSGSPAAVFKFVGGLEDCKFEKVTSLVSFDQHIHHLEVISQVIKGLDVSSCSFHRGRRGLLFVGAGTVIQNTRIQGSEFAGSVSGDATSTVDYRGISATNLDTDETSIFIESCKVHAVDSSSSSDLYGISLSEVDRGFVAVSACEVSDFTGSSITSEIRGINLNGKTSANEKNFSIENCYVHSLSSQSNLYGTSITGTTATLSGSASFRGCKIADLTAVDSLVGINCTWFTDVIIAGNVLTNLDKNGTSSATIAIIAESTTEKSTISDNKINLVSSKTGSAFGIIAYSSEENTVRGCSVNNISSTALSGSHNSIGIDVRNGAQSIVSFCLVDNVTSSSNNAFGVYAVNTKAVINSNKVLVMFSSVDAIGIRVASGESKINDNYVQNLRGTTGSFIAGIYTENGDTSVSGNIVQDVGSASINSGLNTYGIYGSNPTNNICSVVGNTIRTVGNSSSNICTGVFYTGNNNSKTLIANNTIDDIKITAAPNASTVSRFILASKGNVSIIGNKCSGMAIVDTRTTGASFGIAVVDSLVCAVENNTLTEIPEYGIWVGGITTNLMAENYSIRSNTCVTVSSFTKIGIRLECPANPHEDFYPDYAVIDNDVINFRGIEGISVIEQTGSHLNTAKIIGNTVTFSASAADQIGINVSLDGTTAGFGPGVLINSNLIDSLLSSNSSVGIRGVFSLSLKVNCTCNSNTVNGGSSTSTSGSQGIFISGAFQNTINGNTLYNFSAATSPTIAYGILCRDAQVASITGNTCTPYTSASHFSVEGIRYERNTTLTTTDSISLAITGNTLQINGQKSIRPAVFVHSSFSAPVVTCAVTGNTIRDWVTISATISTQVPFYFTNIDETVLSGNIYQGENVTPQVIGTAVGSSCVVFLSSNSYSKGTAKLGGSGSGPSYIEGHGMQLLSGAVATTIQTAEHKGGNR